MVRHFTTADPNDPEVHYTLPAAPRLAEARLLIERWIYFGAHAPPRTGKTTALRALAKELTSEGRYASLHFDCEEASLAGNDLGKAIRIILEQMRSAAESALAPDLRPPPFPDAPEGLLLGAALRAWAVACPRPLVLMFDQIDSLAENGLMSVLRQIRAGYPSRTAGFPRSIILCATSDLRDYEVVRGDVAERSQRYGNVGVTSQAGELHVPSPFHVIAESIRLPDFDLEEVRDLYGQHTAETRQPFTAKAICRAFELTAGQPWLVNALAREAVHMRKVPPSEPITAAHIEEAKERLISARATHLDSLSECLAEPRVRRVLEPLIAGDTLSADDLSGDTRYVRDIGLVAPTKPARVANPIYREMIVRVLGAAVEWNVTDEPRAFVLPDGRLAFRKLLRAFGRFWGEHGQALLGATPYHEVAAQLVFMAFLQRIVNGGGYVDREYGVGRGRIDLLVRWPYHLPDGRPAVQRRAIEIKVWRPGAPDPLKKGLAQLDDYLAHLGLRRGTLVIFDRRKTPIRRPEFLDTTTRSGRSVRLLRA